MFFLKMLYFFAGLNVSGCKLFCDLKNTNNLKYLIGTGTLKRWEL